MRLAIEYMINIIWDSKCLSTTRTQIVVAYDFSRQAYLPAKINLCWFGGHINQLILMISHKNGLYLK